MQTLTKMDRVVIEDYYHMTTMDENVNPMKQIHLLSNFPLKYIYLYFKFLNTL